MNQILICGSTGRSVTLTRQIASSGEGIVWETSRSGYLAKLYHQPSRERIEKLRVMIANPPQDPMQRLNHISFAWPQELLLNQQGQELGFLMPTIKNSVKLSSIYNPRLRNRKAPRFNWYYLHTTALNIASVLESIHAKGYVVGDIKPQNLLVNNQALVSVIDTDSFQVRDAYSGQIFRCLVGSEGFTPVELLGKDLSALDQTDIHDRFRLGVLIYLLLFGDHPFKGKWIGGGEPPNPTELIRHGYWPYAPNSLIQAGPSTISLAIVHPDLQACFRRCFTDGHHQPSIRPTASEWLQAVKTAITTLQRCPQQSNHYYNQLYGQCYWCERKRKLGLDVFDIHVSTKATAAAPPRRTPLPATALWRPASAAVIPIAPKRRPHRYSRYKRELGASAAFLMAMVCFGLLIGMDFERQGWFRLNQKWMPEAYNQLSLAAGETESTAVQGGNPVVTATRPPRNRFYRVSALAVTADGNKLITGGENSTIQVWDLTAGYLLHTLHGHSDQVVALATSTNGQTLFSSGADGEIISWNINSGQIQRLIAPGGLRSLNEPLRSVAISSASQMIASSGWSNRIMLRNLQTGKRLYSLNDGSLTERNLAISADGRMLASSSGDGDIKLWNLKTGTLIRSFPSGQEWHPPELPRSLAISPSGKTLVSSDWGGVVVLRDLHQNRTRMLRGHAGLVQAIVISANGQRLITGSADHTIKVWNLSPGQNWGQLLQTLIGHQGEILSLSLSADGRLLASTAEDQITNVWQLKSGKLLYSLP